jgi:hypothetical protein
LLPPFRPEINTRFPHQKINLGEDFAGAGLRSRTQKISHTQTIQQ